MKHVQSKRYKSITFQILKYERFSWRELCNAAFELASTSDTFFTHRPRQGACLRQDKPV